MAIALAVGLVSERWTPPEWIDLFGAWVSIAFLLALGIVNLRAVLAAPAGAMVGLVGVKGGLLARLAPNGSPLGVAVVGALFALSFDTVSQSALFALTATQFGGVAHSLMLGGLFVLGMLATDAVNGWWIARLIARADQIAAVASRVMSIAVSAVSLLVAAMGIAKLVSPSIDAWSDGKELAFGAVVVAVIALSYVAARLLVRASASTNQAEVAPSA
jgi:high-affinity nickel-transport protein